MCLGIPGKVTQIKGKKAKLQFPDHDHWVDISAMEKGVHLGDYLHTYQNTAINKVPEAQAKESIQLLKKFIDTQK